MNMRETSYKFKLKPNASLKRLRLSKNISTVQEKKSHYDDIVLCFFILSHIFIHMKRWNTLLQFSLPCMVAIFNHCVYIQRKFLFWGGGGIGFVRVILLEVGTPL